MTNVIDLKKSRTYKSKTDPEIIDVPEMLFVMVDGKGAPESSQPDQTKFQKAMQIMFGIVYGIKFWDKKHAPPAGFAKFTMAPTEGLWWMEDGGDFDMTRPKDWRWTVMIRLPEFVTLRFFNKLVEELVSTRQSDIYHLARLKSFAEGKCVQIMHVGPYSEEGASIKKMHDFAAENGYILHGKHHELYFGDPRRTTPEKLRTILRQPVMRPA